VPAFRKSLWVRRLTIYSYDFFLFLQIDHKPTRHLSYFRIMLGYCMWNCRPTRADGGAILAGSMTRLIRGKRISVSCLPASNEPGLKSCEERDLVGAG
jgi:hypothetical protein